MAPLRKCVSFLRVRGFIFRQKTTFAAFMKKYAVGYDGGCWEYITYENGACAFIAPDGYQLTLPNYFDEPVSANRLFALQRYMAFEAWLAA